MLQSELSCSLILLFVLPLLHWTLWSRPKPAAYAILSISLSRAAIAARIVIVVGTEIRSVYHVVVRHGNLTSVRDVVLVRFLLAPYGPNSL